jgi:flagellar motor switch protein FliN/FliY
VQGEEVPVRLETMSAPEWEASAAADFLLAEGNTVKVQLRLLAAPALLDALASSQFNPQPVSDAAAEQAPSAPASPAASERQAPPAAEPRLNIPAQLSAQFYLGMLSDIPLNARLSFGDHMMPLSDVLGCIPGSVVESDRDMEMPVELWVEGFLAARGDIVIVDGNYGVRVRELCYSQARGSSLSRGTILAA